jgi:molybdenum cofactor cytidylyltransferase
VSAGPEPVRTANAPAAAGVFAAVLAAGKGRRMGGPKHLLPVGPGGEPMLACCVRALLGAGLAPAQLAVVLRAGDEPGQACARELGVRALAVSGEEGRSASVRTALGAAPAHASGFLFALADQPLLLGLDFAALLAAFAAAPERIAAASYAGERGSPVLFPARLRGELLALRGAQGGRAVLGAHPQDVLEEPLPPERGRDLDSPQDFAELRDALAAPRF